MNKKIVLVILLYFLFFHYKSSVASEPPSFLIDKGICPFECCTYREWTVGSTTKVYEKPDINSKTITVLEPPEVILAETGEIHVAPVKFYILKDKGDYKSGDVLWVYSYLGEGYFKAWYKGSFHEAELNFSPYGGDKGLNCELSRWYCFGKLEKELKFTWWIKIRTQNGFEGWAIEKGNFGEMDSCS